jgi:alkylated DNA repair dioxygenase AlkB
LGSRASLKGKRVTQLNLNLSNKKTENNLLPQEGALYYYGPVMSYEKAEEYYNLLFQDIKWKNDEAIIFGKKIITKRKVAWYADRNYSYTYSKVTRNALLWIPVLRELKELTEEILQESFNSCLLNLYHDGSEGMAWHCDEERELKKNGAIGSLSFGAQRKFLLKHKVNKEKVSIDLEAGSLLVMKGETQSHWLHRLPPTKKILSPRINLTFRSINN